MISTVKLDTRELDRIARELNTNTRKVVESLAFEVEARAKEFAPVDTGFLRSSGFTEVQQSGDIVAIVGFEAIYAPFIELGTYKMGAQPFLMPALQTVSWKMNQGITWQELVR